MKMVDQKDLTTEHTESTEKNSKNLCELRGLCGERFSLPILRITPSSSF